MSRLELGATCLWTTGSCVFCQLGVGAGGAWGAGLGLNTQDLASRQRQVLSWRTVLFGRACKQAEKS